MKWIKKQLRYIFLTLFLITNSVIVFESSLAGGTSGARSNLVALIISVFVNENVQGPDPGFVPVTDIVIKDHTGAEISEGATYDITLGVTRLPTITFFPETATDKSVTWSPSTHEDILTVYPSGRLEARKLGEQIRVDVTASNAAVSTFFYVDVVPKRAPVDFEAHLLATEIVEKTTTKLEVQLDEMAEREYDPTLLSFHSSDETVALINNFGVIRAISPGEVFFSITGHDQTYPLRVVPEDITSPVKHASDVELSLPDTGYVYDKIPLNYTFDILDPTDPSVTITSSNEAIAKVLHEEDGYFLYGNKVSGTARITVYVNTDPEFIIKDEHDITFVNVLPETLALNADKESAPVGSRIRVNALLGHTLAGYTPDLPVTDQNILYTSSDTNVASVSTTNLTGVVYGKKVGTVIITATSRSNPDLQASITLEIKPPALINDHNFHDFQSFVRKTVGHFLLFFVNAVFGFWTFYLFYKDKHKRLKLTVFHSLIVGLFFALLSEGIQLFVPNRTGSLIDVLIDFSGYLSATILFLLVVYFTRKRGLSKPPSPSLKENEKIIE